MSSLNQPSHQVYSFFSIAVPIGFKVVSAIICGGLIGLEREFKNKPAGIKTNILICLGSALYTIISILMSQSFVDAGFHGDPARIAAQIVPGIGFIGAGTIMISRGSILGLTTAATIWIVAAIGVCIGAGYPVVAFVFTVTVLFTLLAIEKLEQKFIGKAVGYGLEIVFEDDEGQTRARIDQALAQNEISLNDFEVARKDKHLVLRMQYTDSVNVHKHFIADLWTIKGVREVKQL